ncbi:MAG: family 16 glycoside hydrolase [Bacteroidota bacterium]
MMNKSVTRMIQVWIAIIFIGLPSFALGQEWKSLFDGESLEGWENPYEWGEAVAEDGEIQLKADEKFFLCTEKEYDNFVFEAEVKLPEGEGNSGFMFRAASEENNVWGYQAEVDPSERAWSGGIYGEGFGAWRFQPRKPNNSPAGSAFRTATKGSFKPMEWNKYRIECEGNRIKIYVNGTLCSDYFDDSRDEGVIALQHHGEDGKVYRFRNIRIKEIRTPEALGHGAKVVFNEDFDEGKMENNWKPTDPEAWEMAEVDGSGVLHLKDQSDYEPEVRSPHSILWLMDDAPESFVMDALLKYTGEPGAHADLCLFFGKQDPSHFYYVHLGQEADPHAHSIFAVDGEPRVSIASWRTRSLTWGDKWHRVRIVRNGKNGVIRVYFDDLENSIMEAKDKRFMGGGIGIGSFDNKGYFDDIRIVRIKP